VDEYLSDKEQVERLRQWWRENGWFLLGGVALGLLGLYGYNQYFAYQDRQSEEAAALYAAIKQETEGGETADAATQFTEMRREFPDHAYTHQAALLLAKDEIVSAPDAAAEKLRFTMEQSDDPELSMVARLRLARVLAYRERHQDALALLDVPDPGQFAGRIAEIRGDIHAALGDTDEARTSYLQAMVAPGAELLDRSFLQMKLSDLPGATPAPASVSEARPAGAPNSAAEAAEAPAEPAPAETAAEAASEQSGEGE
jgi:predicted negative regulator of RcsB-dependent stress response